METPHHLSHEIFSYSLRFSFNADSFIEFDPRVISMRLTQPVTGGASDSAMDLDSLLSGFLSENLSELLLSPRSHHQSHRSTVLNTDANPSMLLGSTQAAAEMPKSMVLRSSKVGVAFRKYILFVLMKLSAKAKRLRLVRRSISSSRKEVSVERGRRKRVCDVDVECSIDDAVIHCKNSNGEFMRKNEGLK